MIEAGLTGRASCWEQLCPLLGPPVSSSWAPSYSKALWWWWLPESSGSLGVSACGPCPEALVASFRQCMMHVALYGMLIWQQPSKYTIGLTGMCARQGQKWNNWCWGEWGESGLACPYGKEVVLMCFHGNSRTPAVPRAFCVVVVTFPSRIVGSCKCFLSNAFCEVLV